MPAQESTDQKARASGIQLFRRFEVLTHSRQHGLRRLYDRFVVDIVVVRVIKCLACKTVPQLPLLKCYFRDLARCHELKDFTDFIVLPLGSLKGLKKTVG